jgi:hypothetical protein
MASALLVCSVSFADSSPGKKELNMDCGFGGLSMFGQVKLAYCQPTELPKSNEIYQVTFIGFGLSFGGEGGTLAIKCIVPDAANFTGYYVGSGTPIYGIIGKPDGHYNTMSFISTNTSSCEITSQSRGFIMDAGPGILEVLRYR